MDFRLDLIDFSALLIARGLNVTKRTLLLIVLGLAIVTLEMEIQLAVVFSLLIMCAHIPSTHLCT